MRKKLPIRAARGRKRKAKGDDGYAALLQVLKTTRQDRGMTQAALAVKLGRDQVSVAKIENGTRRIDPVELLVILDALDADPAEFFDRLRQAWQQR
jgi:ribosome-binding protein aMBF1 (putative translation factor)